MVIQRDDNFLTRIVRTVKPVELTMDCLVPQGKVDAQSPETHISQSAALPYGTVSQYMILPIVSAKK